MIALSRRRRLVWLMALNRRRPLVPLRRPSGRRLSSPLEELGGGRRLQRLGGLFGSTREIVSYHDAPGGFVESRKGGGMSDVICIILCKVCILSNVLVASEVARCLREGNVDVLSYIVILASRSTGSPPLPSLPLSPSVGLWLTELHGRRQAVLVVAAGRPRLEYADRLGCLVSPLR